MIREVKEKEVIKRREVGEVTIKGRVVKVGDRLSFLKRKDFLVEGIEVRTIKLVYIEDETGEEKTVIYDEIYFREGCGYVHPGAFKELYERVYGIKPTWRTWGEE